MDLWSRLTTFVWYLLDTYDYQAVFLLVFIEELGIPLPVPGDFAMLVAGYRVGQGQMNLLIVLGLLEVATVLGASLLYGVGARGGRPLIVRYGRYIHVSPAKLDRAEAFLERRGAVALVVGRLVPGLRIVTTIVAGILGVSYLTFLVATALGSFIYIVIFVTLGLWLGPYALEALAGPELSWRLVVTVLLFAVVTGLLIRFYWVATQRQQPTVRFLPGIARTKLTLLAGFLATIEMGLGVSVLTYVLGALHILRPAEALILLVREAAIPYAGGSSARFLLLLFMVLLFQNFVWAPLYALIGVRYLPGPGPLQGLLFAVIPFLFSGLVLLPLMGAGLFGLTLGAGFLPLVGEVLRNAFYGLSLGAFYRILEDVHLTQKQRAQIPL